MGQRTGPLKFIVIGAGQRGIAYANPVSQLETAEIHAVAEPAEWRRKSFGEKYIWGRAGQTTTAGEGQEFSTWTEWLDWEVERRRRQSRGEVVPAGVDGVFVCTLDEMHVEIMVAIAPLNLHVMCEKPLATSLTDCLKILRAFEPNRTKIFSIGHVLRYSPHNLLLRKMLLEDRVVGDILSIEHTEPVGWHHFAHSYTRGNWRRQTKDYDGSLLTKCCHDLDFLLWILSQPADSAPKEAKPHLPRSVMSVGSLNQFRKSRKPAAAGSATNCLSCPMERDCQYSAVQIYDDTRLAIGYTHWLNHVVHDIEDIIQTQGVDQARKRLHAKLAEDYDRTTTPDAEIAARPWYGRCVYEADNDVCDDQVVTITWDEDSASTPSHPGKTAILHMIANTEKECERRGVVYGTHGELSYDGKVIRYFDFVTRKPTVVEAPKVPTFEQKIKSHGGGDQGLARAFIAAVDAVENKGVVASDAQVEFVGCTLEDAIRSHAMVFAAEEARRDEKVVKWSEWWNRKNAAMA